MPLFYSGQSDYIAKMNAASDDAFSTAVAATVGGTTTLDLSTGGSYFITMGAGNTTIAFTNVPTNCKVIMYVKQDATGSRLITWPGTPLWSTNGSALTTTGSKTDIIEFRTVNGGSTWYANILSKSH